MISNGNNDVIVSNEDGMSSDEEIVIDKEEYKQKLEIEKN